MAACSDYSEGSYEDDKELGYTRLAAYPWGVITGRARSNEQTNAPSYYLLFLKNTDMSKQDLESYYTKSTREKDTMITLPTSMSWMIFG